MIQSFGEIKPLKSHIQKSVVEGAVVYGKLQSAIAECRCHGLSVPMLNAYFLCVDLGICETMGADTMFICELNGELRQQYLDVFTTFSLKS